MSEPLEKKRETVALLRRAGWKAALYGRDVLVLRDGVAWRVAGGDAARPSLLRTSTDPRNVPWNDPVPETVPAAERPS